MRVGKVIRMIRMYRLLRVIRLPRILERLEVYIDRGVLTVRAGGPGVEGRGRMALRACGSGSRTRACSRCRQGRQGRGAQVAVY